MDSPFGNYGSDDFNYRDASGYHRERHNQALRENAQANRFGGIAIVFFGFVFGAVWFLTWLVENWLFLLIGAIYGVIGLVVLGLILFIAILIPYVLVLYTSVVSNNMNKASFISIIISLIVSLTILFATIYPFVGFALRNNETVAQINTYILDHTKTGLSYLGAGSKWSWNFYLDSVNGTEKGIRKLFDIEKQDITENAIQQQTSNLPKINSSPTTNNKTIKNNQDPVISKPVKNSANKQSRQQIKQSNLAEKQAELQAEREAMAQIRKFNNQLKAQKDTSNNQQKSNKKEPINLTPPRKD